MLNIKSIVFLNGIIDGCCCGICSAAIDIVVTLTIDALTIVILTVTT